MKNLYKSIKKDIKFLAIAGLPALTLAGCTTIKSDKIPLRNFSGEIISISKDKNSPPWLEEQIQIYDENSDGKVDYVIIY